MEWLGLIGQARSYVVSVCAGLQVLVAGVGVAAAAGLTSTHLTSGVGSGGC